MKATQKFLQATSIFASEKYVVQRQGPNWQDWREFDTEAEAKKELAELKRMMFGNFRIIFRFVRETYIKGI